MERENTVFIKELKYIKHYNINDVLMIVSLRKNGFNFKDLSLVYDSMHRQHELTKRSKEQIKKMIPFEVIEYMLDNRISELKYLNVKGYYKKDEKKNQKIVKKNKHILSRQTTIFDFI